MTIEEYQKLTGIIISTSRQAVVKAHIKRTQTILESMLGFTLDKHLATENRYKELGKSPTDFILPTDDSVLLSPDEPVIAYRLFKYNEHDKFFSIDPALAVYAVKLVYVRGGETPNGITLKTFDLDEYRVHVGAQNIRKFIEKVANCWQTSCLCDNQENVQLAVDADWLFADCLPSELNYLWADMVTYYSNQKKDLKSETLGSHSYTRATVERPESLPESLAILKKYAGPYGSLTRTPTL